MKLKFTDNEKLLSIRIEFNKKFKEKEFQFQNIEFTKMKFIYIFFILLLSLKNETK